jgi:ribosome maturation factor RimP
MKIKKIGNTESKVFELVKPIAETVGVDIWDVSYLKEGAEWYLRVFIDKEEGISLDDCEAVSRPLSKKLDEVDPVPNSYILEVGSAGLERDLIRENHFTTSIGKLIIVKFIIAEEGIKEMICELLGFDKENIKVIYENSERTLKLSNIANIKLYVEYEN